jgi:hypothetical protein
MGQREDGGQGVAEQEQAPSQQQGLGFGHLSMNEVPPSARVAEEDAPRQGSRAWLLVILVLVGLAVVAFGVRMIANVAPGQEAELRLRQQIEQLPAWQKGDLMQVQYLSGNTLRLEFATRLRTVDDADREAIRQATGEVFEILREQRPGRDLYIEGYQDQEGEQIVRGEYRSKRALVGPGGEQLPDISIRVKGDPEGGMQGAYSNTTRVRR